MAVTLCFTARRSETEAGSSGGSGNGGGSREVVGSSSFSIAAAGAKLARELELLEDDDDDSGGGGGGLGGSGGLLDVSVEQSQFLKGSAAAGDTAADASFASVGGGVGGQLSLAEAERLLAESEAEKKAMHGAL
eukprot:COSAG06_NODE_3655_length_5064_cov_13.178651_2_plen_134_part_00